MKFTSSWLKEYFDTHATLDEILTLLTALGIEVESVVDQGKVLSPFIVAEIIEAAPHPDADRLQVCKVTTGTETFDVVCGAPNARAGLKGVFAGLGVAIPGSGMVLKKTKIRGVESTGMMCSARELGLGEDHDGIIELPENTSVGLPFAQAMGLDDAIIDVAITPNRADCLGVSGIARDLAAAGLGKMKPRPVHRVEGAFESPVAVTLDFSEAEKDACPMFAARLIRGVKNGESPDWLKAKLTAVGLRPISALVDITNYFTIDRGRPLHVYDASRVKGGLSVRLSKDGEKLAALNDKDYSLSSGMTVICDEDGVLGLGGVIGGTPSGCTEETTDVILECALFDPIRTAATGRKLQIESDARYRFERGVDPASTGDGIEAATAMILDLCGGEPSKVVVAGAPPDVTRQIALRFARVRELGGVEIEASKTRQILERLGFSVGDGNETVTVTTPSWRRDVEGEADLVEEILRVYGYDRIPVTSLPRQTSLPVTALSPAQRRVGFVRRALASRGLTEAVTWSFLDGDAAALFGGGNVKGLWLVNPISSDLSVMRPSLLPNLVAAAARNMARGMTGFGLFEIGSAYGDDTPKGQSRIAAGIRVGDAGPRHWATPSRSVDVYDAKADALAALKAAGVNTDRLSVAGDAPDWYHPGRSGVVKMGPKNILAIFGELHPGVLAAMDIKGNVAGFEVFLDAVPAPKKKAGKNRSLLKPSPFQPVARDFAFVVGTDVVAASVLGAVTGADKTLIEHAEIFDVYEGQGIGEDEKSLAVTVTLQPLEKTLTDEDIEAVCEKIVDAVAKSVGGRLRG